METTLKRERGGGKEREEVWRRERERGGRGKIGEETKVGFTILTAQFVP